LVIVSEPSLLEIVYQTLKYNEDEVKKHNTGSAIPHTDKGYVLQLEVKLLPNVAELSDAFAALRRQIIANSEDSRCLAELRDTLLPRLMSGELSVNG
jgi:type I restriction enzyme S subunit